MRGSPIIVRGGSAHAGASWGAPTIVGQHGAAPGRGSGGGGGAGAGTRSPAPAGAAQRAQAPLPGARAQAPTAFGQRAPTAFGQRAPAPTAFGQRAPAPTAFGQRAPAPTAFNPAGASSPSPAGTSPAGTSPAGTSPTGTDADGDTDVGDTDGGEHHHRGWRGWLPPFLWPWQAAPPAPVDDAAAVAAELNACGALSVRIDQGGNMVVTSQNPASTRACLGPVYRGFPVVVEPA